MLMPKKNRVAIYEYLFKEGVMVAERDPFLPKHPKVDVPNLHVIKALLSLKSRGFVKEQFAWRHFYWCLTNEGIQYLRDFLHLPAEIVPATLKRQTRAEVPRAKPKSDGPPRQGGPSDRQDYRRGPGGGDKKSEVGAGSSNLEFRGGFGRGRGGFGGGASSGGQ